MKRIIGLIKVGDITLLEVQNLRKNLEKSFKGFNLSIAIIQEAIPLENADYNRKRRQYNASKILTKIIYTAQNKQFFRILGVLDEDIYTEPLNFVFGLAMNPKTSIPEVPIAALISIKRLRENFYGKTENKALFAVRILKEAIHELGHTFSLEHCNGFCIMRFSNSLSDTDKKPPEFCETCYEKMVHFFESL